MNTTLCPPPPLLVPPPAALQAPELLASLYTAARQTWPEVMVSANRFAEFIELRLAREPDRGQALANLRAADLYLLCGYTDGDRAATRILQGAYISKIEGICYKLGLHHLAKDLMQTFAERLLAENGPHFRYAGRGDLMGWIAISAARDAGHWGQKERRHDTDDLLENRLMADSDLDSDLVRHRYQPLVKAAFRAAIAALPPRDRNLLRYFYLDGLNIDAIGAIYGKHRATVARWLAGLRENLVAALRAAVMAELGASPEEAHEIMQAVRSGLGTSMMRALAGSQAASPHREP